MAHSTWSAAEKKIARRVFEAAVDRELQALLAEFKAKATSIQDPTSIWPIRDWLDRRQREIDSEFDFRYSVLVSVFGRLVRDGRVYGRGTCDMKAFYAIALAMLPEFKKAPLKKPIHFALSYDEEIGCLGAPQMIEVIRDVMQRNPRRLRFGGILLLLGNDNRKIPSGLPYDVLDKLIAVYLA